VSAQADEKAVAAGKGRFAEVIASRGGLAAPEAPFVIGHREAQVDTFQSWIDGGKPR
jgi:hypothetical protein